MYLFKRPFYLHSLLQATLGCFLLSITLFSKAQTQQGYVKTLGRNNKPGVALGGVSVRVRGGHNEVLSKSNGTFSMQIQGESYNLQRVQKTGYELNESGIIGRQLAYSSKVPLTIVMRSVTEAQREKQRISEMMEKKVAGNYQSQMTALEKRKSARKVEEEEYSKEIQRLGESFEKAESFIDYLAEHYAHVDYDFLDERQKKINFLIENGELERAKTLVLSSFDINAVSQSLADLQKSNIMLAQGGELRDEALRQHEELLKMQQFSAEMYYHLYTIALSRFENDSARYFITRRADLDTTCAKWQMDAAEFLAAYYSDYKKSLSYYFTALKNCQSDELRIECYGAIAALHGMLGDYTKANTYNSKAKELALSAFGEDYAKLGSLYVSDGVILTQQGDYPKAKSVIEKGIKLLEKVQGDKKEIATSYAHLGAVYLYLQNDNNALDCYEKALKIRQEVYKEDAPEIGRSCSHLGLVFLRKGKTAESLSFFKKALEIYKKNFGERHHALGNIYFQISQLYTSQYNYVMAAGYAKKALEIYLTVVGENHADVGVCYGAIAVYLTKRKEYVEAIDYFQKALDIFFKTVGENHVSVAYIWSALGDLSIEIKAYQDALTFYTNALKIYEKVYGPKHHVTKMMRYGVTNTKALIEKGK